MQSKNLQTWDPSFAPCFTPEEMLDRGVFMDCHYNYAINGLPDAWYKHKNVLTRKEEPDEKRNYYGVVSRQSLKVWRAMAGPPSTPRWAGGSGTPSTTSAGDWKTRTSGKSGGGARSWLVTWVRSKPAAT